MHSQFVPLLRNEVAKAIRRKLPYFGLFCIGLLSVVIHAMAGQLNSAANTNAWSYVVFSMQLLFSDIGPVFIIVFSAMLLAEETAGGTIRAVLAAPVYRWELYVVKAVTGLLYALVLSAVALLCSAMLAKVHYHFDAVGDSFGIVYSRGKVMQHFLLGYALSWVPLGALVMCGLFISTVIRGPGAAVAVGIGSLFVIDFTKHMVGLDPYFFTRYIEYSWLVLQQVAQGMDCRWQPEVWKMLGLSGAYGVVTFGAGLIVFVRQDLNHST
jgi:ABC-type transport system involved in multi-copper enzyme maturation permease subunit